MRDCQELELRGLCGPWATAVSLQCAVHAGRMIQILSTGGGGGECRLCGAFGRCHCIKCLPAPRTLYQSSLSPHHLDHPILLLPNPWSRRAPLPRCAVHVYVGRLASTMRGPGLGHICYNGRVCDCTRFNGSKRKLHKCLPRLRGHAG